MFGEPKALDVALAWFGMHFTTPNSDSARRTSHGRAPPADQVFGASDALSGVLKGNAEKSKEHPQRREVLLDGGGGLPVRWPFSFRACHRPEGVSSRIGGHSAQPEPLPHDDPT